VSVTGPTQFAVGRSEDSREARRSSPRPAVISVDPAAAAEDTEERSSKVVVEDGVQDRVDRRIGVAEPEEERTQ